MSHTPTLLKSDIPVLIVFLLLAILGIVSTFV
jgi:hypothetical protein